MSSPCTAARVALLMPLSLCASSNTPAVNLQEKSQKTQEAEVIPCHRVSCAEGVGRVTADALELVCLVKHPSGEPACVKEEMKKEHGSFCCRFACKGCIG